MSRAGLEPATLSLKVRKIAKTPVHIRKQNTAEQAFIFLPFTLKPITCVHIGKQPYTETLLTETVNRESIS
jgi:hypothetical protein